jgi:hypothetical protein
MAGFCKQVLYFLNFVVVRFTGFYCIHVLRDGVESFGDHGILGMRAASRVVTFGVIIE